MQQSACAAGSASRLALNLGSKGFHVPLFYFVTVWCAVHLHLAVLSLLWSALRGSKVAHSPDVRRFVTFIYLFIYLFIYFFVSIHRHWCDRVQSSPRDHPHWTGKALLAQAAPVEEDPVPALRAPNQNAQRRSTDHHLLCCGGKSGQGEWALLQVKYSTLSPYVFASDLVWSSCVYLDCSYVCSQ